MAIFNITLSDCVLKHEIQSHTLTFRNFFYKAPNENKIRFFFKFIKTIM